MSVNSSFEVVIDGSHQENEKDDILNLAQLWDSFQTKLEVIANSTCTGSELWNIYYDLKDTARELLLFISQLELPCIKLRHNEFTGGADLA